MNYNYFELKKMREEAGLSLSQLSEMSGISKKQIINMEKGRVGKSRDSTLEELAKVLCQGNKDSFYARLADTFENEKRFLEVQTIAQPLRDQFGLLVFSNENEVSTFLKEFSNCMLLMTADEIQLFLSPFCKALLGSRELTTHLHSIETCWGESIRILERINDAGARKVLEEMKKTSNDNNFSKKLNALKSSIVFCEQFFDKNPERMTTILIDSTHALDYAVATADLKKELLYQSIAAYKMMIDRQYGVRFRHQESANLVFSTDLNVEKVERSVPPKKKARRPVRMSDISAAPCEAEMP